MNYLSISNWKQLQHYKYRNPPWIRLYQSILRERRYQKLSDITRSHLIGLFILASQYDNQIPNDLEWLQHELCTKEPIDLKTLIDSGWIQECEFDASKVLAHCKQSATPETETETELQSTERETESRGRNSDISTMLKKTLAHYRNNGKGF